MRETSSINLHFTCNHTWYLEAFGIPCQGIPYNNMLLECFVEIS